MPCNIVCIWLKGLLLYKRVGGMAVRFWDSAVRK